MDRPLLLPLAACTEPSLVGGKAVGLARLLAEGFPVPSGFCVTTEAYDHALRAPDFSPAKQWQAALHSSGVERRRILSRCHTIIRNHDIVELTTQIDRTGAPARSAVVWVVGCEVVGDNRRWSACEFCRSVQDAPRYSAGGNRFCGEGPVVIDLGRTSLELSRDVGIERSTSRHGRRDPAAVRGTSRRRGVFRPSPHRTERPR